MKTFKYIFYTGILFLVIAQLAACNQSERVDEEPPAGFNPPKIVKPDSMVEKLRPAIVRIESYNLQLGGYKLKYINIDSIEYNMISMKDYLLERQAQLEANLKISADQEKTGKVIKYLQQISKQAPVKKDIYKVSYHMNAQAGEYIYKERHSNYLEPGLTELHIRFPDL